MAWCDSRNRRVAEGDGTTIVADLITLPSVLAFWMKTVNVVSELEVAPATVCVRWPMSIT